MTTTPEPDEDAMAAEWAAMAGADPDEALAAAWGTQADQTAASADDRAGEAAAPSGRTLSQNEIDSLLGVGTDETQ